MNIASTCQQLDGISISVIERSDRTFEKKGELFLENTVLKNQIYYSYDPESNSYTTENYLIEKFIGVWSVDTIVDEKQYRKNKKWRKSISSEVLSKLQNAFHTDIDSLDKSINQLHTSHHYLIVHVALIYGTDTANFYKTKPFEYLTPWSSNDNGSILNPSIDRQLFNVLPKKFLAREVLNLSHKESTLKEKFSY